MIRLRQHGLARLLEDVVLRVLRHLRRHVRIPDDALAALRILLLRDDVSAGHAETALNGADIRRFIRHLLQSRFNDVNGCIGIIPRRNL